MPTRPGQAAASFFSAARSNLPSGACAITALGMPLTRISAVSARVSMPHSPIMPRLLSQSLRLVGGAVVRLRRDGGMQDDPARARRRRHIDGLDVFFVGADIADVREGEGDDLPGIRGVGEDLLIAGHGGVEADLADRGAGGAQAEALQHGPVGQHQKRRRLGLSPSLAGSPGAGGRFRLGHGHLVAYYSVRSKGPPSAAPRQV